MNFVRSLASSLLADFNFFHAHDTCDPAMNKQKAEFYNQVGEYKIVKSSNLYLSELRTFRKILSFFAGFDKIGIEWLRGPSGLKIFIGLHWN